MLTSITNFSMHRTTMNSIGYSATNRRSLTAALACARDDQRAIAPARLFARAIGRSDLLPTMPRAVTSSADLKFRVDTFVEVIRTSMETISHFSHTSEVDQ